MFRAFCTCHLDHRASPQQAPVVIAALMAGKVFISVVHYLLDPIQ